VKRLPPAGVNANLGGRGSERESIRRRRGAEERSVPNRRIFPDRRKVRERKKEGERGEPRRYLEGEERSPIRPTRGPVFSQIGSFIHSAKEKGVEKGREEDTDLTVLLQPPTGRRGFTSGEKACSILEDARLLEKKTVHQGLLQKRKRTQTMPAPPCERPTGRGERLSIGIRKLAPEGKKRGRERGERHRTNEGTAG